MLRRLALALCLVFTSLPAAPALAQNSEAQFAALMDNLAAAGRPSIDALTAEALLMGQLVEVAGMANTEGLTPEWVAAWNTATNEKIAGLEAVMPSLAPMSPASIQKLSLGNPQVVRGLNRVNRVRAGLLDSARQAIFFARECQTQAAKAAKGDEQALQRVIRSGIASTRLTMEAQITTLDGAADDMPDNQPQKPLSLAAIANDRATLEVYRLLERSHTDESLDVAGTARRMREHAAEARRQAALIVPAMTYQLNLMNTSGTPPQVRTRMNAILVTFRESAETEIKIANVVDAAANRLESHTNEPGDNTWGLDLATPLIQKRGADHAARVKMIQAF